MKALRYSKKTQQNDKQIYFLIDRQIESYVRKNRKFIEEAVMKQ